MSRLAGALANVDIKKGDVVAVYLPMIPEAFYAIFACSKIGAVHTTIFSGFSAQALYSRLVDSKAKLLITIGGFTGWDREIDFAGQWQKAVQGTGVCGQRAHMISRIAAPTNHQSALQQNLNSI